MFNLRSKRQNHRDLGSVDSVIVSHEQMPYPSITFFQVPAIPHIQLRTEDPTFRVTKVHSDERGTIIEAISSTATFEWILPVSLATLLTSIDMATDERVNGG